MITFFHLSKQICYCMIFVLPFLCTNRTQKTWGGADINLIYLKLRLSIRRLSPKERCHSAPSTTAGRPLLPTSLLPVDPVRSFWSEKPTSFLGRSERAAGESDRKSVRRGRALHFLSRLARGSGPLRKLACKTSKSH